MLGIVPGMNRGGFVRAGRALDPVFGSAETQGDSISMANDNRYTLSGLHAQGGLGWIFRAQDRELSREVALKMVRAKQASNDGARERLIKEAQVNGQLEHPNIVPVYDFGHLPPPDEQPFFVMKLVRGRTLNEAIGEHHAAAAGGAVDAAERRRLLETLISVCNAIGYAHSRGVVHCDLKPDNVILGNYGEVHLLDSGLAKILEPSENADHTDRVAVMSSGSSDSRSRGMRGSPLYMSPEQAGSRFEDITGATDIYGLGLCCSQSWLESLTCRRRGSLVRTITSGWPSATPQVKEIRVDAPKALNDLCAKAMARGKVGPSRLALGTRPRDSNMARRRAAHRVSTGHC